MKLNVKIALYYFFFKAFVDYVTINMVHLGVSLDVKDALKAKWVDVFETKFSIYSNPTTNNSISRSDMFAAFNECAPFVEGVRLGIKNNPLVVLDATDRANTNIPVEKKRTKIPVTDAKPNVTAVSKTSMIINLFVFDPAFPTKKVKPLGAGQVGYMLAIMPVGAVPVLADYRTQLPEKSTMFPNFFTLADVGKNAWYIAYYLSPTNEKGENGEPFSTLIV